VVEYVRFSKWLPNHSERERLNGDLTGIVEALKSRDIRFIFRGRRHRYRNGMIEQCAVYANIHDLKKHNITVSHAKD
jgi:hypothetical protein